MLTLLKIISGFLLMMAVVTGCSSSTGYFIGDSRNSAPRRAADVLVVDHVNASDYQVIGRVHAQSTAPQWLPWSLKSREALLQQLKKQAALLHADVIFDVRRYSRSQFEWQEEHLMATAAVIIKKRAGDAP